VALLPAEPEARGLLALMLYCESRRAARRAPDGRFAPLKRQDARLWSREMIIEAEQQLTAASRAGVFGRFQCEAGEPAQAIAALSRLAAADVSSYQPYWVTLASARAAAGDSGSASQALQTAIGLTEDPAIRSFLAASLPEARRA
jgi:RNA polymerase sigma-70 factor (ECF subfamily)